MSEALVIPGLDDEEVSTLLNVRTYKQYCLYVADRLAGRCPFCQFDRMKHEVVAENDSWIAFKNLIPLRHTSLHLVIAHKEHLTHIDQLSIVDWKDWGDLMDRITDYNLFDEEMPGGAIFLRFGDPTRNAGSIRHLHANIIIPDGKGEVRVPLAKDPKDVEEKKLVIAVFEKIRLGTRFEDLLPAEQALVEGRLGEEDTN